MQKLAVLFLIPLFFINLLGQTSGTASAGNHVSIVKKTLDNGVTVLLIEDHSAPVISCQVYSRMGTRDEFDGANGSAYLIGLSALGRADYSYREGIGLLLNGDDTTSATINKDFVGLMLRGSMDKLDSMVERASGLANYDSLSRDFASKQKTVLDQSADESNRIVDAGESLKAFTYDRLFETAYGSEGDAHSLIGGQDAGKLTEAGFLKFVALAGAPEKLVVVIAGDLEPTYTMLLANRWFGHRRATPIPVEKTIQMQRPVVPAVVTQPSSRKRRTSTVVQPQPVKVEKVEAPKTEPPVRMPAPRLDLKLPTTDDVLAISYRAPGAESPDFAALTVLAAILGGSQSSILATRFMNRDSTDYRASELSCRLGPYGVMSSRSLFALYLREPKSPYYSIWQSEHFINDEIAKLKQRPIDPELLSTAKKVLLAEYRRRTESIDGRAFAISQAFLRTGDPAWADNYALSIQSVTIAELQTVANRYLIDTNRTAITIVSAPNERIGK